MPGVEEDQQLLGDLKESLHALEQRLLREEFIENTWRSKDPSPGT